MPKVTINDLRTESQNAVLKVWDQLQIFASESSRFDINKFTSSGADRKKDVASSYIDETGSELHSNHDFFSILSKSSARVVQFLSAQQSFGEAEAVLSTIDPYEYPSHRIQALTSLLFFKSRAKNVDPIALFEKNDEFSSITQNELRLKTDNECYFNSRIALIGLTNYRMDFEDIASILPTDNLPIRFMMLRDHALRSPIYRKAELSSKQFGQIIKLAQGSADTFNFALGEFSPTNPKHYNDVILSHITNTASQMVYQDKSFTPYQLGQLAQILTSLKINNQPMLPHIALGLEAPLRRTRVMRDDFVGNDQDRAKVNLYHLYKDGLVDRAYLMTNIIRNASNDEIDITSNIKSKIIQAVMTTDNRPVWHNMKAIADCYGADELLQYSYYYSQDLGQLNFLDKISGHQFNRISNFRRCQFIRQLFSPTESGDDLETDIQSFQFAKTMVSSDPDYIGQNYLNFFIACTKSIFGSNQPRVIDLSYKNCQVDYFNEYTLVRMTRHLLDLASSLNIATNQIQALSSAGLLAHRLPSIL